MGNGSPESTCWNCGAPVRADERYCGNCGADQQQSGQGGPQPQQGGPPPQGQGGNQPPPQGQSGNQPPPQGQPPGGPQQGQGPPPQQGGPQQGGPPPQGQQPAPRQPRQNQRSSSTWILIILAVIGGGLVLTVILAAVIGSFVLGLGDTTQSGPSVAFAYEYNETTGELEVTHEGGDEIDAEQVYFEGDVQAAGSSWADVTGQDTVSAGDTVTLAVTDEEYELQLFWEGEDGADEIIGEDRGGRPAATTAQRTTPAMASPGSLHLWDSVLFAPRE